MLFSRILIILALLCCVNNSLATVILVENTLDAGTGSLRDAVASASPSANDTILIDVKGTIELESPINFNSFTALTIIGPYAKHNTITASGIWTGSLFNLENSESIHIKNLGFVGGNGNTRHITINNCANDIRIDRCLFEASNLTTGDGGGAINIINSNVSIGQCSFIDNQASIGGAIATSAESEVTLVNCTFSGNYATDTAGALHFDGSTTAKLLFNTIVNNNSANIPHAIKANNSTNISLQNNAIGDNGSDRQITFNGLVGTTGRNIIKKNYFGEPYYLPLLLLGGDYESSSVLLGLRGSILEDGYGLKYWPITNASSDLINPTVAGPTVPAYDCRNAPRNLKGPSLFSAYPDAGACEYTHLRITNDSGELMDDNSFLWALDTDQQKDDVHYIEFDISPVGNIVFETEGIVDEAAYIIDGFSQPGSAIPGPHEIGTPGVTPPILPIVFEDGDGLNHGIKFDDNAEGSIVQGVRIIGFDQHGFEPNRSENISLFGCEIGIDEDGVENGNGWAGVKINSDNNVIGGWEHWMRNTLSGNGLSGSQNANIYITYGGDSNVVQGNIIGGFPDGITGIGLVTTTIYGIYIASWYNLIGGTLPNTGNTIIANDYGSYNFRTGDYTTYCSNRFGVAWDGVSAVGNTEAGIFLGGSDNNTIGGYSADKSNEIAHNGKGIVLTVETTIAEGNAILGNSIHDNIGQGIDIKNDNIVLANDGIYDGTVSNRGIDYPEISSTVSCGGANTLTTFQLSVPPGEDYRVEFFSVTSPDPITGEGETLLGTMTVSVTSNPESFTFDHGMLIAEGKWITSTVTQISTGNTSEFGNKMEAEIEGYDPSFSYADICPWEVAVPSIDGDLGGSFRFSDPVPVDGAMIDDITGEVTGAIEGTTYEVIYGFISSCIVEDTTTFTVRNIDESFVFDDICPGDIGTAYSIATPGGIFDLEPDGGPASITSDTGILTGGIEGTVYTVRYIANDGTCIDTGFVDVTITATDESFTMADFCAEIESPPAVPVTSGGTYYFAPPPGDGATIDASTGAITGGVEGATYYVRYVVGTCGEEDTISVNVISLDESFTFNDFCPDSVGLPEDGVTGGFSFLTPPGDGASIDSETGGITFGTEGTTYSVLRVVTDGTCFDRDTAYPKMIEVLEGFVFPDFCENNDSSDLVPIAEDPINSNFSLFDPGDGATINPETGRIYFPEEGTTYTVIDSVWNEGCWQADTNEVTTILVNENFAYNPVCFGSSGLPYDVEFGGNFSILDDPGDGVTINATTGEISGGIEGVTYTVRHIMGTGTCADTLDLPVTFVDADASFTFADFCPGDEPSPTPIATNAGGDYDFASPPADGETINTSTGSITGHIEGHSYDVSYTFMDDAIGCTATEIVTVNVKVVNEEVDYVDFCWNEMSDSAIVTELGTITFGLPLPEDGAYLSDDGYGVIMDATEGTAYEIVHTLTVDGCTQSDSTIVTAIGVDESFIFNDYCAAYTSPTPTPAVPDGEWSFFVAPALGTTIDSETGVITNGLEDSIYYVMYTAYNGECSESSIDTVLVLGSDESFTIENFCAEFPSESPVPATEGGEYSFAPDPGDGAVIDPITGIITMATEGESYNVKYSLLVDGCSDEDTQTVIAYASENADFSLESYCANIPTPLSITGTEGGFFSFDPDPAPDGATIDPESGVITGSVGGDYDVTYITPGSASTCSDTITQTITLYDIPEIITISSVKDIFCPAEELTELAVTESFACADIVWYQGDVGGAVIDTSFAITPTFLEIGENTFYAVPISEEACKGDTASYILILSDTAGMGVISDFEICLGSSAELEAFGGANYEWNTEVPLTNYTISNPTAFSLNEEYYVVSIFNHDNCEVKDSIHVTFLPQYECDIEVYNAFSPNEDGKNDFWYIDNLINYLPNTVYIYNRWGSEINKIENYDNITSYWDGKDSRGNDLPPNTYYYVVITEDVNESQAGWVQLVR